MGFSFSSLDSGTDIAGSDTSGSSYGFEFIIPVAISFCSNDSTSTALSWDADSVNWISEVDGPAYKTQIIFFNYNM